MRYIIFDTETTGVDADKQAVEVALLEVDHELNMVGEAESLLLPSVPISEKAQAIHGISIEMLADKPSIHEWVETTFGGRLEGEVTLIGHKIAFDRPLFEPIGDVSKVFDTLIHAQVTWPDAPDHKLETLRDYLGLVAYGDAHRAMADVKTCYQVLQQLVEKTGRSFEALMSIEKMFIHRMPWGKHEGKSIFAVPQSYRNWLLEKDIDPNLRYTLEEVSKLDIQLPKPGAAPTKRRIYIPPRKTA